MNKKFLAGALACALVFGAAVGGTLAWLQDSAGPVVNTFTEGDVAITLTENEGQEWKKQALPGQTYTKDPVVTVLGNKENADEKTNVDTYLFVKVLKDKSGFIDKYYDYTLTMQNNPNWTQVEGTNIWYTTVPVSEEDQQFHLLAGDTIRVIPTDVEDLEGNIVKTGVTKDNMEEAASAKLTFMSFAIQEANVDVEDAIEQAQAAFDEMEEGLED